MFHIHNTHMTWHLHVMPQMLAWFFVPGVAGSAERLLCLQLAATSRTHAAVVCVSVLLCGLLSLAVARRLSLPETPGTSVCLTVLRSLRAAFWLESWKSLLSPQILSQGSVCSQCAAQLACIVQEFLGITGVSACDAFIAGGVGGVFSSHVYPRALIHMCD